MLCSLSFTSRTIFTLPVFLAPAFADAHLTRFAKSSLRGFASTHKLSKSGKKPRRDANKSRGVSALRSTGTRYRLLAHRYPLPEPAKDAASRPTPYEMNDNHGLYKFFNANRDTMLPASEEESHGRAWTERELSKKDFFDLWKLHWTCVLESNRITTRNWERDRLKVGYGQDENADRLATVRKTMANIRKVLIQRHEDFNNGTALLRQKFLIDIFPDCEALLGIEAIEQPDYVTKQVGNTNTANLPQNTTSSASI